MKDFRRARAELIAGGNVPARARAKATVGKKATIYVDDVIDSWGWPWGVSASEFRQALDEIDADEIDLHINSPGGEASEGVTIMNHLRNHKAKVTAYVDGMAASAASVVMLGADEVFVSPGALVMIHDAWNLWIGNAEDMRTEADVLDKVSQNMADLYAAKTGKSAAEMRDLMRPKDTWLTGAEAVDLGLADGIDNSRSVAQTEDAKAKAMALGGFSKPATVRIDADLISDSISRGAAAIAATHRPPAEPADATNPNPDQEVTVAETTTLRDGVAAALGVNDADASDDVILAALNEALTEQAETPVAVVVAETGGPDLLAEVTRLSTELAAVNAREADRDKAAFFDAAGSQGRFTPAERAGFEAMYDQAPDATKAFILARAVGSAVPVASIGHNGGLDAAPDVSADLDAWASALGLPEGSIR